MQEVPVSLWSFVLAALGIAQIILTGKKIRHGWLVGVLTSILWFIYGVTTQQYGFLISAVVFGVIHLRNWLAWRYG